MVPSNFNPAINPAPPVGGLFQSNHKVIEQNDPPIDNFAPRVGFAWQPLASNRLVFRGGFGFFYDRQDRTRSSPPQHRASRTDHGRPSRVGKLLLLRSGFPMALPQRAGLDASFGKHQHNNQTGSSSNLSQVLVQQIIHAPLIYEWNLNAQYEFLPSWVLELGYVGSHGIHQNSGNRQINEALWRALQTRPDGLATNTVANASLRVPYLGFSPGGMMTQTLRRREIQQPPGDGTEADVSRAHHPGCLYLEQVLE